MTPYVYTMDRLETSAWNDPHDGERCMFRRSLIEWVGWEAREEGYTDYVIKDCDGHKVGEGCA